MKRRLNWGGLFLCFTFLTACSSDNVTTANYHKDPKQVSQRDKIMEKFQQWRGVRYKYGGTTKRGVDCSAFVQSIYSDAFNKPLPRTTSKQKHLGKAVKKQQLAVGDLVFFRGNTHVGIYVGNGEFIHSSTTNGVTLSKLNNLYYRRHYTQSRRII